MSNDLAIRKHGEGLTLSGVEAVQTYGATGGNVKWVDENEAVLKGKFITENGTYKAEDDGALGYKRVVVMSVAGTGEDTPVDSKKQSVAIKEGGSGRVMNAVKNVSILKSGGGGEEIKMIVMPTIETKTLNITAPGVYDIATDQNRGEAIAYSQVTVNVSDADRDAAGFNPENPTYQDDLPYKIMVTTPPIKTDYMRGETIDYTGMVVKAYRQNGTLWTNSNYPDGVIPHNELELAKHIIGFDGNEVVAKILDKTGINYPYNQYDYLRTVFLQDISTGKWYFRMSDKLKRSAFTSQLPYAFYEDTNDEYFRTPSGSKALRPGIVMQYELEIEPDKESNEIGYIAEFVGVVSRNYRVHDIAAREGSKPLTFRVRTFSEYLADVRLRYDDSVYYVGREQVYKRYNTANNMFTFLSNDETANIHYMYRVQVDKPYATNPTLAVCVNGLSFQTKEDWLSNNIHDNIGPDKSFYSIDINVPSEMTNYSDGEWIYQSEFTMNGKTVSYCLMRDSDRYKTPNNYRKANGYMNQYLGNIAWSMVYGESAIIINWQRPVDRKTLSTLLSVNIA